MPGLTFWYAWAEAMAPLMSFSANNKLICAIRTSAEAGARFTAFFKAAFEPPRSPLAKRALPSSIWDAGARGANMTRRRNVATASAFFPIAIWIPPSNPTPSALLG